MRKALMMLLMAAILTVQMSSPVLASELSDYNALVGHPDKEWAISRLHDLAYKVTGDESIDNLAHVMQIRQSTHSVIVRNSMCSWDITTSNIVCSGVVGP